jgi:hypothetical protein
MESSHSGRKTGSGTQIGKIAPSTVRATAQQAGGVRCVNYVSEKRCKRLCVQVLRLFQVGIGSPDGSRTRNLHLERVTS